MQKINILEKYSEEVPEIVTTTRRLGVPVVIQPTYTFDVSDMYAEIIANAIDASTVCCMKPCGGGEYYLENNIYDMKSYYSDGEYFSAFDSLQIGNVNIEVNESSTYSAIARHIEFDASGNFDQGTAQFYIHNGEDIKKYAGIYSAINSDSASWGTTYMYVDSGLSMPNGIFLTNDQIHIGSADGTDSTFNTSIHLYGEIYTDTAKGITGNYVVGTKTISVVNGLITGIV
jgi:hypothetical protein